MVQVLTLRELETASGEPRSTIYYYLRRGLLPRPQKTASGRSLYSEDHLSILEEIVQLKTAGFSLAEIERTIQPRVVQARQADVDLAAQEHERVHNRILAVATDEFFSRGYKNTHVSHIIKKLGITITVFYSHFSSKRTLLAECVVALVKWSEEYLESQRHMIHDPVEQLLWFLFTQFSIFQLGAAARAVLEVEAPANEGSLQQTIAACHAVVVDRITRILEESAPEGQPSPEFGDRLIAESLYGAADLLFRFSSDEYDRKDLIRAHLWLMLAALAARNGQADIRCDLDRYEGLVEYFSTHMPPRPPVLEM